MTDKLSTTQIQDFISRQTRAQANHFRAAFLRAQRIRPDGFTIDSLGNVRDYPGGFAVGIRSTSYADIDELIRENFNVVTCGNLSTLHFGFWRDASTGETFIDAVEVYDGIGEAIETAVRYGQKAIWDFANKKEVNVADYRNEIAARVRF